ncbi:hypothetical protein BACIT_2790 [Bacillus amyloliquefaciens]|nr:hypothetical protein BACIT_2790 [Bacillus amyloliquefaciens]
MKELAASGFIRLPDFSQMSSAMIICPVEETGAYSVSPSTIPKTAAVNISHSVIPFFPSFIIYKREALL